ncbi:hypothetical protein [Paraburkholderia nodosa]|uniref:hypothetical protein n=1 Tax=Paraburkholderia nodosa TaxID=392320 RepID=UPI0012B6819D|nr:hypothetical protein [Paraburkholderia nodosa]
MSVLSDKGPDFVRLRYPMDAQRERPVDIVVDLDLTEKRELMVLSIDLLDG